MRSTRAAPFRGFGLARATPVMREWMGISALALEPADPVCYAPLWRTPPAGRAAKEVLAQVSIGDHTVPVATGAALGRAAGLISPGRNALLIQKGVIEGRATFNPDRVAGVESHAGAGIRFLGVDSHVGMLVPNPQQLPASGAYADAAQAQMIEFIRTGTIDDGFAIFDTILPP
jgi:hypothetical protein